MVKSRRGFVTSLNLGINFAQYVAIPRKLRTSLADDGGCASWIALTFSGSGDTPSPENTKPKKVIDFLFSSHLSSLRVSPTELKRCTLHVVLRHALAGFFQK